MVSEQKQLEAILTNLNQEHSKQTMEDMMMYIMADNLRNSFNNDIKVYFIEGKKNIILYFLNLILSLLNKSNYELLLLLL
jgi:hypothetical protein